MPRVEPPNHLSPTCHVVVLTKTGSRGKGRINFRRIVISALQDELTGTEKGTDDVFLHTTVDDGDHFQQILAWTLKSRCQKQNQQLREVTASFRSVK